MKACIFDLDGTLLDSMDVWQQIDKDFLKKRGIDIPSDYIDAVLSMSFIEAASYTMQRFHLLDTIEELCQEWHTMAITAYTNTIALKPGAKEYLLSLHKQGILLAVATNLPEELYKPALVHHGIYDLFTAFVTVTEVQRGKKYSDIFLLTAHKLQVKPQDCIVFEDTLVAIKSAKRAEMKVYAILDGASKKDKKQIEEIANYSSQDFYCFIGEEKACRFLED